MTPRNRGQIADTAQQSGGVSVSFKLLDALPGDIQRAIARNDVVQQRLGNLPAGQYALRQKLAVGQHQVAGESGLMHGQQPVVQIGKVGQVRQALCIERRPAVTIR